MDAQFFEFEADFVKSLHCIPMCVRFKLDLCGVKMSLRAWNRIDTATRERLATLPVDTPEQLAAYGDALCQAIESTGEQPVRIPVDPHPAWADAARVPVAVADKVQDMGLAPIGADAWSRLGTLPRFALVKLTRGGHENENFLPALREFGLAP